MGAHEEAFTRLVSHTADISSLDSGPHVSRQVTRRVFRRYTGQGHNDLETPQRLGGADEVCHTFHVPISFRP